MVHARLGLLRLLGKTPSLSSHAITPHSGKQPLFPGLVHLLLTEPLQLSSDWCLHYNIFSVFLFLACSLHLMLVVYRERIVRFCVFIQSDNLCLLVTVFRPLIFSIVIDMFVLKPTISLVVICMFRLFFTLSSFSACFYVKYISYDSILSPHWLVICTSLNFSRCPKVYKIHL